MRGKRDDRSHYDSLLRWHLLASAPIAIRLIASAKSRALAAGECSSDSDIRPDVNHRNIFIAGLRDNEHRRNYSRVTAAKAYRSSRYDFAPSAT